MPVEYHRALPPEGRFVDLLILCAVGVARHCDKHVGERQAIAIAKPESLFSGVGITRVVHAKVTVVNDRSQLA